jgi:hypothetical protein
MSEARLTIHFENKSPIELIDFTESFEALGNEYYKFLSESDDFRLKTETKLYVKEIRNGSVIAVLSDLVPAVIPFVENSNSVIEFTKFLKKGYEYFLGNTTEKPKDFDIKDCNNFNNIIKPVAKDNGSNIVFTGDFNFGEVTVNLNYSSQEANAIQNGIARFKTELKEPISNIEKNVLFYWDSAKYEDSSKSIDKGFIDSIHPSSLKVVFNNQEDKKSMLDTEANPFHFAFLVDVEILTVQKIPTAYKILKVNDTFPKE